MPSTDFYKTHFKYALTNKYRQMKPGVRARAIRNFRPIQQPYPYAYERQMRQWVGEIAIKPLMAILKQLLTKENYERWIADYNRHDKVIMEGGHINFKKTMFFEEMIRCPSGKRKELQRLVEGRNEKKLIAFCEKHFGKSIFRKEKSSKTAASGPGSWITMMGRHVFVSADGIYAHADTYAEESAVIMASLKRASQEIYEGASLRDIEERLFSTSNGVYKFTKNNWGKATEKVLGQGYWTDEKWWAKTRMAWANENLTLIRGATEEFLKKANDTIYRSVRNSWTWGDITSQLIGIGIGMSESRAALIARDQVGKLNGQLSKYRQTELGLNYYIWATAKDERVRGNPAGKYPEAEHPHFFMEGLLCDWRDSSICSYDNGKTWVARPSGMEGLIPGEDIQCFLGQTPVRSLIPTEKLYRRFYTGKLTQFIMEDGESFTCTGNHPILRADGVMIPAQFLNIGDEISNIPCEIFLPTKQDINYGIPSFQEAFDFLSVIFTVQGITGSEKDFHSDGIINEQVDIIFLESPLGDYAFTKRQKGIIQQFFTKANMRLSFLVNDSQFVKVMSALGFAPDGFICLLSKLFSIIKCHPAESDEIVLRAISELDIIFSEYFSDSAFCNIIFQGQSRQAFARSILLNNDFRSFRQLFFIGRYSGMMNNKQTQLFKPFSKLVTIKSEFPGKLSNISARFHQPIKIKDIRICESQVHVYNLQNKLGWYIITDKGIIVKNCRCQALAWFGDILAEAYAEFGTDSLDSELYSGDKKTIQADSIDDTKLSNEILSEAVKTLYKIAEVNRQYDIPYLAGYSKDGKTIYIDRHLPEFLIYQHKKYPILQYLVLHETEEKALEDSTGLSYQLCHQLALRGEKAAVESETFGGRIPWDAYNAFCDKWVKLAGDEKLTKVPSDLDIKPYESEKDIEAIKKIQEIQRGA
jgi:hypothetical protein